MCQRPRRRPTRPPRISLTPRLKKDTLGFNALFTRLAVPDNARVECTLTLKGETQPRRDVFSVPLVATRPDSERAVAEAEVPMEKLGPGSYRLVATARDASGKPLASIEKDVAIPPPPDWFGSKAGVTDAVLPPYMPVEVNDDAGAVLLERVGTDVSAGRVGPSPPDRHSRRPGARRAGATSGRGRRQGGHVVRRGADDPRANARPGDARTNRLRRPDHREDRREHRVRRTSANRLARSAAAAPVEIQSLVLEIPVKPEHARYLYTWPTAWGGSGFSGELARPMEFNFHPIVWLGRRSPGTLVDVRVGE